MKSLSVGAGSVPWKSIEVKRAPSGAPSVMLHGAAAELAATRAPTNSISRSRTPR